MTPNPEVQEKLRRYLLGNLGDDDSEQLERELLTSDELFEELLIVEDEITDEYLAGELSDQDRSRFEQYFLNPPERQEKLKFARALNRAVKVADGEQPARTVSNSFWSNNPFLFRAAAIAAVVVIIAGVLWSTFRNRSTPATFAVVRLTLSQGTRSGDVTEVPTLHLPLREDGLRIVMALPSPSLPATRYRVQMETDYGDKRYVEPVIQDNQSVTVTVPSGELRRGQYSLILFAVMADGASQRIGGSYRFNVQ